MRRFTLALCAGLTLFPLAAAAAPGASGGVTGDVRCLMTMAHLSSSTDATQARLGQIGVVYFAGRVKGQDPAYDFATRLKPVAATLNREALNTEVKRCGPMLSSAMRELDSAQKSFGPPKPASAPGKPPAAAKPPAK